MKTKISCQVQISPRLIITPQFQETLKILKFSWAELKDKILKELQDNPALEETPEYAKEELILDSLPDSQEDLTPLREVHVYEDFFQDIDWSDYIDEYNSPGAALFETEKRDASIFESFQAPKESLREHLLWQLLMTSPTEEQANIGTLIAGNLNPEGYLDTSLKEIAAIIGTDYQKVLEILKTMQTFDPSGVCARSLTECLMIQLRDFNLHKSIVANIILNHLKNVETKSYDKIASSLGITYQEVKAAVDILKNLNPKPGLKFFDSQPQYITPDVFVYKYGNEFLVLINDDGMPKISLNRSYKKIVKNDLINKKDILYIKKNLHSGICLIRNIHLRNSTVYKVMKSIVKLQTEFFEKGSEYLKPMFLKDVAFEADLHESTVSRVANGKYVHTPKGLFQLKFFFSRSLNSASEKGEISDKVIKRAIKKMVKEEDTSKPFTDKALYQHLINDYKVNIARRTVTKYRENMGIEPSYKRKRK